MTSSPDVPVTAAHIKIMPLSSLSYILGWARVFADVAHLLGIQQGGVPRTYRKRVLVKILIGSAPFKDTGLVTFSLCVFTMNDSPGKPFKFNKLFLRTILLRCFYITWDFSSMVFRNIYLKIPLNRSLENPSTEQISFSKSKNPPQSFPRNFQTVFTSIWEIQNKM